MSKKKNKNKNKRTDAELLERDVQRGVISAEEAAATQPEPAEETEETKKGYETPIWKDEEGKFIKCDKKEFGHSLSGKIDFCRHQMFMYEERMKELIEERLAKNDPAKKLKLSIDRKRKALAEEEAALKKLSE